MKKSDGSGCVALLFILIVLSFVVKLKESLGDILFFIIIALIIALGIFLAILNDKAKKRRMEERITQLMQKYSDNIIVDRIMAKNYWQGQTTEMLVDSLGKPATIEEEILKTKKKEIWKYFPDGSKQFKLRITLEDDIVVGWKRRD